MAGANFAVRKEAFLKSGGFNTKIKSYEDIELSQRLKEVGETKLNPSLRVETSGRRFKNGLLRGLRPWVINEAIRIFEVDKDFVGQPDIREEKPIWAKLSFAPGFLCVIFLFALFYFSNPSISEAAGKKFFKEKADYFVFKIQNQEKEIKKYLAQMEIDKIYNAWEENKRILKIRMEEFQPNKHF